MSRWSALRRVFRLPATRRRIREELDDELRFHLEGRVEDLMEREHLSRADAEREARRRFGDYRAYRREVSAIDDNMLQRRNRMELLETIARETRHAARTLARTPSFSLIALVTLALGLGAATTIFTLLDRVVLRPLPYPNADRMIHIGTLWPKISADEEYGLSPVQFFYFTTNSTAIEKLALYSPGMVAVLGDGDRPAERVPIVSASSSLFGVLGIVPAKGRLFTPEESFPEAPAVVLITHGYWQRRFGGDTAIVGKRLQIGSLGLEIVGVLPPNASVPDITADIWLPKHLNPSDRPINNHTHMAVAVVKRRVTLEAVAADLKRLQDQLALQHPDIYSKTFIERVGFSLNVTWLRDLIVGDAIVRALWIIFAGVGFVLLIAGANVANLFLVRIDARRREVAVRTALGASRSHLAIHFLTESMLIAVLAAAGAIALGYGLLEVVLAIAPQSLPRLEEVTFDVRGVVFCIAAAVAFGTTFGLLPLASANNDVATLRDGGRGMTSSRRRETARRALVISQVALAVVLLTGATLMVKSFVHLRGVKPGFDPVGVQTFRLGLPHGRYRASAQQVAFWKELSERVEALPGVRRAGFTTWLPLTGSRGCNGIGTDATTGEKQQCMPAATVSPGYFETMGIAVSGVAPNWSSVQAAEGPIVVGRAFAKRFWPGENAVGRAVQPMASPQYPWHPVVGVAEDVRANGLREPPVEIAYMPLVGRTTTPWSNAGTEMTLVVRAPGIDSRTLMTEVRRIVQQMDAQVPLAEGGSMEVVIAKSMAQTSFTMLLLLLAAAIALVLSAVGIYGVIAYVVSQRRSEIGIRMALGAQVGEVARMVVTQSVALASAGALIGVGVALIAMRLLASLLFEVRPTDPAALLGTCVVLIVVAALASAGPARRAAKVDPVEAMRG